MPLNSKGRKVKRKFEQEYGKKTGDRYFFASEKSGRLKGVKKRFL